MSFESGACASMYRTPGSMFILENTGNLAVNSADRSTGRCSFNDAFGHTDLIGVGLALVPIVHELLLVDALHIDYRIGMSGAARDKDTEANDQA